MMYSNHPCRSDQPGKISFSAVDDKLYLHGGTDSEGAATCAEGLFVFTPGMYVCVCVCNSYV